MSLLPGTYLALKQRKALLLCLGVLIFAVSTGAVTLSATGKVTGDIAWEIIAVSPELAGDGPVLNASSQMVSPADSTEIVVNRPEITGGYGQQRKYRVIVTRSSGMKISLRLSEIPVAWTPSNQSGSVTPLYTGYLELSMAGVSYDFVDIVFRPRGEIVTFYIQYALDPDDLDLMGGTSITFTVIDMGNL